MMGLEKLTEYCKSEFEKDLEAKGIDTVCFMGYGYDFETVKVGAEFYFSYLYYCRNASMQFGATKEQALKDSLCFYSNYNFFDRYKLVQKYKYYDCFYMDEENRTTVPMKKRRVYVRVKNLRTNKIEILDDCQIDNFNRFCFVIW